LIFVTVGSMLPFDRLIRAVDNLAISPGQEIFAQIGHGKYLPRNLRFARMLTPEKFEEYVTSATLVIAHAGMGTVITAMEAGKAVVILPRLAALREATTDHQVHTARWLNGKPGILAAASEADLERVVDIALNLQGHTLRQLCKSAAPEFVAKIRAFIDS
jgi:UDP-N-acetylglucosamine transferase subunit ALG13